MDCLIISEGERNAQFAGQLLVSLTGHLGTKTDLSGFRVNQDLKAPVSHKLLLK